jgi:hypothetical protein
MSKNVLAGTVLAVICLAGVAAADCHHDYVVPAEWELFSGTLSGMREAYYILDKGMQKSICAGNRELTFLHATTKTAMLFIENGDANNFINIANDFGVTVVGDYFDELKVNVFKSGDCYEIPAWAPDANEVSQKIQNSIIPEINDIIAELDSISDSNADHFRIFFEPNETGLDKTVIVDYGEVLILKGILAALKSQLEFRQAYNLAIDINDPKVEELIDSTFCGEEPNVNFNINEDFLERYANLLNVLPDGNAVLAQAKQDLITAINYYFTCIDYIISEANDQHLLYIDPNNTALLDVVNENLATLRESLQNDTAGTYPVRTTKTYSINDGGSAIGQLVLTYDLTNLKGNSGSLTFNNGTPSPWNVSYFELDDDTLMIELEPGLSNGQQGGFFEATLGQDGNSLSNGTFEYWGAGVAPCDSVFYEVWAGNTDYCWQMDGHDYLYSIDKQDYVKLGESDGQTKTFNGTYTYYCIAARNEFFLDSIQGSTGSYYSGPLCTGNTSDWGNIDGPTDGHYATVGDRRTLGTFRGYVVITNPGWNGITVYSDRSCYDPVSLSGLSGQLTATQVLNARFDLNPIWGGTARYPNPVNPRDLLPAFDANNEPISCTFGHGLNNDATLGGILPDMNQQDWSHIYGLSDCGNINCPSADVASAQGAGIGDCLVNIYDLAALTSHWLDVCTQPSWCGNADFNRDGSIDFADFATLADEWLQQGGP